MKDIIRIIMICCALTSLLALNGCGSGGGGAQNSAVTPSGPVTPVSYYYNELNLPTADIMSTENSNTGGLILRAAVSAKMVQGSNAGDVFRIDIPKLDQISKDVSYPVGANSTCDILFPNGERSTPLITSSGTIQFSSYGTHNGDVIAGDFDVLVRDLSDQSIQYHEAGHFQFVLNN